ncbi:MAG: aspartate carbamoyltransferase, partial [Proteobacteria bacterium]|nr:aspartate carbamoyltransferase [Pseudomonadota bacterium]
LSENRDDKIEPSIVLNHDRLNDIKKSAIILHSLPRAEELSKDVDLMPQAKYFHQAKNGVSARMAILEFILGSSSGPHRKV